MSSTRKWAACATKTKKWISILSRILTATGSKSSCPGKVFYIFTIILNNNKKNSFSIIDLIKNKIYDVLSIESGFEKDDTYRIIDESEEDYLYPKDQFIIVQDNRKNIKNFTGA